MALVKIEMVKTKNILLIHTRASNVVTRFQKEFDNNTRIFGLSLFDIISIPYTLPSSDYYIVTSANAVAFLPNQLNNIIAVGEATREALSKAGLQYLDINAETFADLGHHTELILSNNVTHLCGIDRSQNAQEVSKKLSIESAPIYEAILKETIAQQLTDILEKAKPDIVVFFSPRSARVFSSLFTTHDDCDTLLDYKPFACGLGLSDVVIDALNSDIFEEKIAAEIPTRQAMIKALKEIL